MIAILLALDPSSTCMGYAVFHGRTLVDAGKLKPRRTKDEANDRIDHMVSFGLNDLLIEHNPEAVVVEDTSGKVGRRHHGNGAGLAVHGKAVGAVVWWLRGRGSDVHAIPENVWTRGTPKEKRQTRVATCYPQYDPAKDKGGDVSDAIGLGDWFINSRLISPARQAPADREGR